MSMWTMSCLTCSGNPAADLPSTASMLLACCPAEQSHGVLQGHHWRERRHPAQDVPGRSGCGDGREPQAGSLRVPAAGCQKTQGMTWAALHHSLLHSVLNEFISGCSLSAEAPWVQQRLLFCACTASSQLKARKACLVEAVHVCPEAGGASQSLQSRLSAGWH